MYKLLNLYSIVVKITFDNENNPFIFNFQAYLIDFNH